MSAVSSGSKRKGGPEGGATSFSFVQATPIPSYLLAVAVGQLEARTVGPRSQVWSEPCMVEAAERARAHWHVHMHMSTCSCI